MGLGSWIGRRVIAAALVGMAAVFASPVSAQTPPAGLERASIGELEVQMASGRLSSEALVGFYLDRIDRIDRAGPGLHAVLALNLDALAEARRLTPSGAPVACAVPFMAFRS